MAKTEKRYEKEGRSFSDDSERERLLFKSLKREHFVKTGLYWAALANLFLALGLFFTRPLWIGKSIGSPDAGRAPTGRAFWLALGAEVIVAGALRAPRMDLSF
jgi:hypothetical protein